MIRPSVAAASGHTRQERRWTWDHIREDEDMTVGQLMRWLRDNGIPDDWPLCVATFARSGTTLCEIEGIKVNSGGRSVQLEVYPDGWWPVSLGTTRFGDEDGVSTAVHGGDADEELYNRACKAYRRGGADRPLPSRGMSDVTWEEGGSAVITLTNINAVLTRYRYNPETDRLRRVTAATAPT